MSGNTTITELAARLEVSDHQPPSITAPSTLLTPKSSSEFSSSTDKAQSFQPLPLVPVSVWIRHTSTSCLRPPQSILLNNDRVAGVTPASVSFPSESSMESEACQTDTDLQAWTGVLSSSNSSSSSIPPTTSAASSMRTRTTAVSSATTSLCVTFAPLPSVEPRSKKNRRPLGIAARGQLLRQRRMQMQYYDYDDAPGNGAFGDDGQSEGPDLEGNRRSRRDAELEVEDPFVTIGKALNDATKVIWRQLSNRKLKKAASASDDPSQPRQHLSEKRSFTWRGRKRVISDDAADSAASPITVSENADSEDDTEGAWRRRKDEDPMTKTIMEGSDDGHGTGQFVVTYDAALEEEDLELARVHDEIRTTVEVHIVKPIEGES
ncbi:hypothetical protein M0805_005540 [Coniferiporia weirii]|nr:hypothetical protein M0805_005540 [Coniferiporia weirii]